MTLNTNSLPSDQVTKDTGNVTFFKCSVCSKSISSFANLMHHYKKEHHLTRISYNAESVAQARYHKCHICAKIILCDNSFVYKHVSKSHGIKPSQYINERAVFDSKNISKSSDVVLLKNLVSSIQRKNISKSSIQRKWNMAGPRKSKEYKVLKVKKILL